MLKRLSVSIIVSVVFMCTIFCDAQESEFRLGRYGADTIFVQPTHLPVQSASIRASLTVEPGKIEVTNGEVLLLPLEVMGGVSVGTGELELSRAKATALRIMFSHVKPLDILSLYRNLDRGIEFGVDVVGFRVPIRITPNGDIVLLSGIDMGVRHYSAPLEVSAMNVSFELEARAATRLVKEWLGTGIMARARYDLNETVMRGFQAGGLGYLSLLIDQDRRLYMRLYGGIDYQPSLFNLDRPVANVYTGLGILGNFQSDPYPALHSRPNKK